MLGGHVASVALGSITLHPHQQSAVERLEAAIDRFGGALLCDDVGMGKTYVAIAVAKRFTHRLIVIPAALVSMWRSALVATETEAELVTFELLSRSDSQGSYKTRPREARYDLVIVDEAHHVRNPRTNRYFALESVVRGAKVLLLSATPIHNRRDDLVALLGLFLGSRAHALTTGELSLCIVRREQAQLDRSIHVPRVRPVVYHDTSDDPALVEQLMTLPPPVPVRDGGLGGALIGRGLVHQWASSEAALSEAIKRRLARATALCASLEAGTYPTARELESWVYGEGALQLGFAELLAAPVVENKELLSAVRTHLDALRRIRDQLPSRSRIDTERTRTIASLRTAHSGGRIVAFSQYAETVSVLFRRLVSTGRVAMLTSHGARVAGGPLARTEAINRFAPRATGSRQPPRAEEIELLLTTDLLSEGVNLQDANVVVHLDIPWTVARMEQRVGRVARLGSTHTEVIVHALRPPRSAAAVLSVESIVERKWRAAKREIGTSAPSPRGLSPAGVAGGSDKSLESVPWRTERLRAVLEKWLGAEVRSGSAFQCDMTIVAAARATETGFIAAVTANGELRLVVKTPAGVSVELSTQIGACEGAFIEPVPLDEVDVNQAIADISEWFRNEIASLAAGLGASSESRRREITARIDASIEGAPPHLRASRLALAARARSVATTPQCAAVERELAALAQSDLPIDEWLKAIADLETTAGRLKTPSTDQLVIHAVLLLRPAD